MVMALEKLLTVAEVAARAADIVQKLRKNGQNEAASVLDTECNRLCKQIANASRKRAQSAKRARAAKRGGSGRFL